MKSVAIAVASTVLMSPLAFAQPEFVTKTNTEPHMTTFASSGLVSSYWTPERLKAAKPLPMPKAAAFNAMVQGNEAQTMASTGKSQSTNGSGPTVHITPSTERLFQPSTQLDPATQMEMEDATTANGTASGVQPLDEGTLHAPYTTAFSEIGYSALEKSYAWRTVGKLYFTIAGVGYQCSASVIQRRVIVTAGHCVHEGNNSGTGWHSNFLFIPAFDSGSAPFKTWTWDYAIVTTTWYSGGGVVPNAADYAMIQLRD